MKRLSILRHAKSSWDDPRLQDFDRPLNERGRKAAKRMGRELEKRGERFDVVLASTAARVRETIDGLKEKLKLDAPIRFEPEIYLASEQRLLKLIRELGDEIHSALLVGHNPGLQRLILALANDDEEDLREHVAHRFPTAAFAALELPAKRWEKVELGSGRIVELILPKELN